MDLNGCDVDVIRDTEPNEVALLESVTRCDTTTLRYHLHQFSRPGISSMILIIEPQLSMYTWPENKHVAVFILTCGESMCPELAIQMLDDALKADRAAVIEITRDTLPRD